MEVASGVHRIEAPLGDRIVCVYLLHGPDQTVLVDTGIASTPGEVVAPALAEIGVAPADIDLVVISHADIDHSGGNLAVRTLVPEATFVAHAADVPLIEDVERLLADRYSEQAETDGVDDPEEAKAWTRENAGDVPIELKLQGEAVLRIGPDDEFAVLHTPGHSLGHLTLFRERDRVAIIADAVLGEALYTATGDPAFPPTYRYLSAYTMTVERVRELRPEMLLTSHFPVMTGADVGAFLDRSDAFVLQLEASLRALLRSRESSTLRELIDELSPQVGTWPDGARDALRFPLAGHLERLIAAGEIREDGGGDVRRFSWSGS